MQALKQISKLANSISPIWAQTEIEPRGTQLIVDPLMKGTLRFSRKLGTTLPIFVPQKQTALIEKLPPSTRRVRVIPLDWLSVRSIVSIGKEYFQIEDITGEYVQFYSNAVTNHDAEETVTLRAVPLVLLSTQAVRTTIVQVRTKYFIAPGDEVLSKTGIPANALSGSQVQEVEFLGTSGFNEYPYNYQLTLSKPLLSDEIYLTANPAYESKYCVLPTIPWTGTSMGMFAVDILSGELTETDDNISETLNIEVFDYLDNYLFSVAGKNSVISAVVTDSKSLLFWNPIAGTMSYDLDSNRAIAKLDEYGHFIINNKFNPPFRGQCSLRMTVDSTTSGLIRFKFNESTYQDFALSGGAGPQYVIITPPTDTDITEMRIVIRGSAGETVKISNWNPSVRVSKIKYTMVGTATKSNFWASSSLFAKPCFGNLDWLALRLDTGDYLNRGKLLL